MDAKTQADARRPIRARDTRWAAATAAGLARAGVTPNAISLASVACAAVAAGGLWLTCRTGRGGVDAVGFVVAIVGVQARLLCNLFDGMVAVEGGKSGPAGEIYNDLPDRIADPIILVAAGYAAGAAGLAAGVPGRWGVELGWLAGLLAVMTAYVRVLGRGLGAGNYFIGPMAKQHRMAVLTAAFLASAGLSMVPAGRNAVGWVLSAALLMIVLGCTVTVVRRTRRIAADLFARAAGQEPRA